MKVQVTTTGLHRTSKTIKPKRVIYGALATLVVVGIFMSLYFYAVSALNAALAVFQCWR